MDNDSIVRHLTNGAPLVLAKNAEALVPGNVPAGLYSIFIDEPDNLPHPFDTYLKQKNPSLIYVGKARDCLKVRLVQQDLRHKSPSTFFRGIGAILGFRPPKGSLVGYKNRNNYIFNEADTAEIIEWINQHLSVRWVELDLCSVEANEPIAIHTLRPLLNTTHNPEALPELAALRKECRQIALNQS